MSRFRKLLMVGLVLGLGFGLAWPFRKTGLEPTNSLTDDGSQPNLDVSFDSAEHKQPVAMGQPAAMGQGSDTQARHVVARMASIGEGSSITAEKSSATQGASFDLANHPAITNQGNNSMASPVTPTDRAAPRTYSPSDQEPSDQKLTAGVDEEMPIEVMHIVRNSDTLEKLAERYLGDGGRALEIFDMNRDRLENPHLLPTGVGLRIPVDPARIVE